jgi:hypothetical protein
LHRDIALPLLADLKTAALRSFPDHALEPVEMKLSEVVQGTLHRRRHAARAPCYQDILSQRPYLRTDIVRRARDRVYEWLAFKLVRPVRDVQIRRLDRRTCLEVMELLEGVSYETIREWAMRQDRTRKLRRKQEKKATPS